MITVSNEDILALWDLDTPRENRRAAYLSSISLASPAVPGNIAQDLDVTLRQPRIASDGRTIRFVAYIVPSRYIYSFQSV
jgi:hypothetical protein